MFFRKRDKSDLVLPPCELRKGPKEQRNDDGVYVRNARRLAKSVAWLHNLASEELADDDGAMSVRLSIPQDWRILDVGCGPMRLLTGLQSLGIDYTEYVGIDVDQQCIDWAVRRLSSGKERYIAIDVENERYNPDGKDADDIELPVESHFFDLVVLRSVFTHMRFRHVEIYVAELARAVKPTGFIYVTAHVEDGVLLETENPPGYKEERSLSKGPLHRVQINRQHFEQLLTRNGLGIRTLCWDLMGQPTYFLSPRQNAE